MLVLQGQSECVDAGCFCECDSEGTRIRGEAPLTGWMDGKGVHELSLPKGPLIIDDQRSYSKHTTVTPHENSH